MTLYLRSHGALDRLFQAFRVPRYPVALGRSQDLASYRSVQLVELEEARTGYLEGSLLPASYRGRIKQGYQVLMPRFIDPADRRRVSWGTFVALEGRAALPPVLLENLETGYIQRVNETEIMEVDPQSRTFAGTQRGVIWHQFRDLGEDEVRVEPRSL